jgi:hypothetical protein
MTHVETGHQNNQESSSGKFHKEAGRHCDEIDLMDYCKVLWKRRYFLSLIAIGPALIVGIILFFSPSSYKMTYIYDAKEGLQEEAGGRNLNKKNYDILLNRFYSEENLEKLSGKMRKDGLKQYAAQLNHPVQSRVLVKYEAIPPFPDLSTLNVTDPEHLNKIRNMTASLLDVTIVGKSMQDLYKLSSVIRDNIENTLLLFMIQEQLSTSIRDSNTNLANIESNRFALELVLKSNNEILTGLKNINAVSNNKQSDVMLQFNMGEQHQYLPLSFQIHAAESKKVELEESIKITEKNYQYYKDILGLNTKILAELSAQLVSDYTAEQFKSFLIALEAGQTTQHLKDYLNSYIRKIENRIAASKPVTEKPEISPVAKGTVKKSGVVFAIAFIISLFSAFLKEGFEKNRTHILNSDNSLSDQ